MRGDAGFPVRIRYVKRGRIRFISHRDVARAFERAFRIARLPLSFTEGFSPRPKVSFGLALPVGAESDAEYLDLELTEPVDLDALVADVADALPEGLDVVAAVALDARAPSLQESVSITGWRIEALGAPPAVVADAIHAALAADTLVGVRRRKGNDSIEDLRPAVRAMAVVGDSGSGTWVEMELATAPRSVRPGEVVTALAQGFAEGATLRTHQWIERDGARHEPLDADTRPRAREARA